MEEIVQKLPQYLQLLAEVYMAVSVLATIIVRLTPSKVDDEKLDKFNEKVFKFLSYLPTIGVNPRTKKLEEALKEFEQKKP